MDQNIQSIPKDISSPSLAKKIRSELIFQSSLALGRTSPNPSVGCAILMPTERAYLLWGGATEAAGKSHAEINALDILDRELLQKKEISEETFFRLYCTLEPCTHQGRTPPCTERILRYKHLAKIIAWEKDPFLPRSGIETLSSSRQRGSSFTASFCKKDGRTELGKAFLSGFFNRLQRDTPRLHFKMASSQDNVIGIKEKRIMISDIPSLVFGQILRSRMDAIIVGMGTILSDLPRLDLNQNLWENMFGDQKTSTENIKPSLSLLSSNPSQPHYTSLSQQEILCSSLLFHASSLGRYTLSHLREYQPDRIFILGRYNRNAHKFFLLQKEVSEISGRMAIFLSEEEHFLQWKDIFPNLSFIPIPPLKTKEKGFCPALRDFLSKRGYNDVLVEGGSGLLDSFQKDIREDEPIYILRSKKKAEKLIRNLSNSTNLVLLPDFLATSRTITHYDLGEDILELRTSGI